MLIEIEDNEGGNHLLLNSAQVVLVDITKRQILLSCDQVLAFSEKAFDTILPVLKEVMK